MANEKNLKPPFGKRSTSEERESQKKGGIKSGEVRRQKSTAKQVANMILSGAIPSENVKDAVRKMGVPESELNVQAAIIAGQAAEAIKGNTRAADFVFEKAGEDEQKEVVREYTGIPAFLLGSQYVDINRDIDAKKHTYYDFKGGRGSLKSSYCGIKMVDLIMRNPSFCGLAIRQLKDTLKDSVYAQITWAIDALELSHEFKCTVSPMAIKRISTGQMIYFRGGDAPAKIKSIKPPKDMHIGVVWIEEKDQLRGKAALRNIMQSAMRGGNGCIVLGAYNTPRSPMHFINEEERTENEARIIHHSHYTSAPREWLGEEFFELAEHTKATNEMAYRHEYGGEAVGNGANVFENVTIREIGDKEIAAFDRGYYGLDWGWYPDPVHFCECYFHAASRKLYIYGEKRYNKKSNAALAEELEEWKDARITADSAENKSIEDFREREFNMRGAIKGPGSVEYSMKWLASLGEIIIDSKRCPHTANEFLGYEYERDKDDNVISGYPDKDNHGIDAVRYALEEIWRKRGK